MQIKFRIDSSSELCPVNPSDRRKKKKSL